MKLLVWLWNPWEKYKYTRHNAGFLFLDFLRSWDWSWKTSLWSEWKYESKFLADISEWSIHWEKIILLKPQTYMNLSGTSVQKVFQFYKLTPLDILVIYDDKDMDFWKIRIRETGSAGWHNGIKDIMKYLWTDWKRIKIWVWKTPENTDTSDWVLSQFSEEEQIDLENEIFPEVVTLSKTFLLTPPIPESFP